MIPAEHVVRLRRLRVTGSAPAHCQLHQNVHRRRSNLPAAWKAQARTTLLSCRPNLAISAFRNDLVDLYRFLDDLGIGYRFALGHFSNHFEETVLFATASHSSNGS